MPSKKSDKAAAAKKPRKPVKTLLPKRAKPKPTKKKKPKRIRKGEMGPPSYYSPQLVVKIIELTAAGKTIYEITDAVGIGTATLYRWAEIHPDLRDAIEVAREVANARVERALLARAEGCSVPAIKIHFDKFGRVKTYKYTEHYPPDTAAASLWLTNNMKSKWKNSQRIGLTGADGKDLPQPGAPQIIVTMPSNGREAKDDK